MIERKQSVQEKQTKHYIHRLCEKETYRASQLQINDLTHMEKDMKQREADSPADSTNKRRRVIVDAKIAETVATNPVHAKNQPGQSNQCMHTDSKDESNNNSEEQEDFSCPSHDYSPTDKELKDEFVTFPDKLMTLLEDEKEVGKYMRWLPNGKAFSLTKNGFVENILEKHFYGLQFNSFTKKLNRWGFRRYTEAAMNSDIIAFHNETFMKGRRDLLPQIRCITNRTASNSYENNRNSLLQYDESLRTAAGYSKPSPLNGKGEHSLQNNNLRYVSRAVVTDPCSDFAIGSKQLTGPINSPIIALQQNNAATATNITQLAQINHQSTVSDMERLVQYHKENHTLESFTLGLLQQHQRAFIYMSAAQLILENLTNNLWNENNNNNELHELTQIQPYLSLNDDVRVKSDIPHEDKDTDKKKEHSGVENEKMETKNHDIPKEIQITMNATTSANENG